jgi:F-type H+-transporting ATPase subunit epsilon
MNLKRQENDMKSFQLNIMTPEKVFFSGKVDMVIMKSTEGDMAVKKNKSPLMAILVPGKVRIFENDKKKTAQIDAGYVRIYENDVTVITEIAQWDEVAE